MIGPPIYLVCACTSGEEFVAAFRRYADKGGIFIPIAEPVPANRRGRFALTLADGGVMIEGEAEVVASSRSTSPLYGRVGMTIRFVELDEPSKVMLAELDRARLATKVTAPSVSPRPADVPATPRPTPPAASGRIDAANALAETIAIGDLTTLADLGPPKAGPRFVIPSIPSAPSTAGPRPKTPSTFPLVEARTPSATERNRPVTTPPPASAPRPRSATSPPTKTQPVAVVPPPRLDPNDRRAGQSSVLPPLEALKVGQTQAVAVVPPPQLWSAKNLFEGSDETVDTDTARAAPTSGGDDSEEHAPVAPPRTAAPEAAAPEPIDAPDEPDVAPDKPPRLPSLSELIHSKPFRDEPPATLRGTAAPRSPIVAAALVRTHSALEVDEKTDLTDLPLRVTSPGLAISPPHDTEMMAAAEPDADLEAPALVVDRPPSRRGPVIEEPTPSGNWTMTPGGAIEVLPKPAIPTPAATAPAVDDGDWTITPDQDAPAWVAPASSSSAPVTAAPTPKKAPRTKVIQAVTAVELDRPAEDKVQIDPSLIDQPPPQAPPPQTPTPMPGMLMAPSAVTPVPGMMQVPQPFASATGQNPVYPTPLPMPMAMPMQPVSPADYYRSGDSVNNAAPVRGETLVPVRRRRWGVIVLSTLTVIAIGVGVLIMTRHPKPSSSGAGSGSGSGAGSGSATIAPSVVGSGSSGSGEPTPKTEEAPVTIDAGVPAIAVGSGSAEPTAPPTGECSIDIVTAPAAVDILDEKAVQIGVSPQKLVLPCGPVRLQFRKATYAETMRNVVATPAGTKLKVALAHATFSVKVSSTPAGASISVGGKPKGFTPTTVQLPMLEASTIVFAKDGFTVESEKVTPRQNNQAVHVQLKKKPRR